jgi:hypothetical protein
MPKNKVFFHLITTGNSEYRQKQVGHHSYSLALEKSTVFFPGWGQAGQVIAILPFGTVATVGE